MPIRARDTESHPAWRQDLPVTRFPELRKHANTYTYKMTNLGRDSQIKIVSPLRLQRGKPMGFRILPQLAFSHYITLPLKRLGQDTHDYSISQAVLAVSSFLCFSSGSFP